ncbi:hypothetical protein CGRA01v4_09036 [Colletotrichum graminicola]|uniref:Uncharacterized protein n=1 Tax=Colletotrichum graminicola (strain M1.001 / M2 / FGSC 10212) TaxID=645133 RepID=E3Q780_COLGM|nr:uncharacterized protein GLRG_02538 [Colletotrichum graminicola M1.001]EFQ26718.1 hypothetical protein GLRG_02538 [Colletotrichum graminicola M1.001]WDK17752.1 hypothetical protein CGRA01v4_09036 [Colletotrichum graminicola]
MCTRNPPQVASHNCRISRKQIRPPSNIFPYIGGPKTEGRRTKANFEVVVVSSRIRKISTRVNQTVRHYEDSQVFQNTQRARRASRHRSIFERKTGL